MMMGTLLLAVVISTGQPALGVSVNWNIDGRPASSQRSVAIQVPTGIHRVCSSINRQPQRCTSHQVSVGSQVQVTRGI